MTGDKITQRQQILILDHCAGGIVGGVQQHSPSLVRHRRLQILDTVGEIVLFPQRNAN